MSGNYDIEYVFIDGFYKVIGKDLNSAEVAEFFMVLDGLAKNVDFVLTVSCDKEELPEFIAKYVK